ncbi:hypothetical protein CHARACLAT_032687, partial [Characodon lateralis]|nr:hypothetical protein [Characodon lateralis]
VPDPASLLAERPHYRTKTKLTPGSSLLLALRPSQPPGQLSRTLSTLRRSNTLRSSRLQAVPGEASPRPRLCSHLPGGANLAPTFTCSWLMVPFSPFSLS